MWRRKHLKLEPRSGGTKSQVTQLYERTAKEFWLVCVYPVPKKTIHKAENKSRVGSRKTLRNMEPYCIPIPRSPK